MKPAGQPTAFIFWNHIGKSSFFGDHRKNTQKIGTLIFLTKKYFSWIPLEKHLLIIGRTKLIAMTQLWALWKDMLLYLTIDHIVLQIRSKAAKIDGGKILRSRPTRKRQRKLFFSVLAHFGPKNLLPLSLRSPCHSGYECSRNSWGIHEKLFEKVTFLMKPPGFFSRNCGDTSGEERGGVAVLECSDTLPQRLDRRILSPGV